jgi:hypothetical protein
MTRRETNSQCHKVTVSSLLKRLEFNKMRVHYLMTSSKVVMIRIGTMTRKRMRMRSWIRRDSVGMS